MMDDVIEIAKYYFIVAVWVHTDSANSYVLKVVMALYRAPGMPDFCVKVHLACLQCQTVVTPKYLNPLWLRVSLTEAM